MNPFAFVAMLAVLVAGDMLWLGVVMKQFYQTHLGHLMSGTVQWVPAVVFYVTFVTGISYFAVLPTLHGGLWKVVTASALLGAFAYATYDLTNHATLKEWPLIVTIVDVMWGTFLAGIVGAVGYYVLTLSK